VKGGPDPGGRLDIYYPVSDDDGFGLSWRINPIRRVIQPLSLLLFLYLFFYVACPFTQKFSSTVISDKELLPVESFLWIDPLSGLSTAIAARHYNAALSGLGVIVLICLFWPRGFCGYLCPLGTLIDGFDWLIGRHVRRFRLKGTGRWINLKYYLLVAVLVSSLCGVLLAGYLAAIAVLTRGLLLTAGRGQLGLMKDLSYVYPATWTVYLSIILFAAVFVLGFLAPRFWCRYICPSGALLGVFGFLRIGDRKVDDTCISCGKCRQVCPFDAVKDDYTTRGPDCAYCQTCGGVCPTGSIKFAPRWYKDNLKPANDPPATARPLSRRGLVTSCVGGVIAAAGTHFGFADRAGNAKRLLRPPGSVPERQFLQLCIRCGECIQVCPGPILRPAGIEAGLDMLWTPVAVPTHSGCHQDCNFCTQVCPTGAIRPLTLEQKRKTHMGLAVVNKKTCLAHKGQRECRLCYDECTAAGYDAIRMEKIELPLGDIPPGVLTEAELEEMKYIQVPVVDADACMGCGLCEFRCHAALVKQEKLLTKSAIITLAENEDRIL